METKETTNEMEQGKLATQDSTTAIDAGTTQETQTAIIANETSKEENKVEEVEAVEKTDNSTETTNDETTKADESAEAVTEEPETVGAVEESPANTDASIEEPKLEEKAKESTATAELSTEEPKVIEEPIAEVKAEEVEKKSENTTKEVATEEVATEEVATEESKAEEKTTDTETITINPDTDYTNHSLEELVDALVELVKIDEINRIKNNVGNIKAQYFKKIKILKQEHHEKFIADGGVEEEYEALNFNYELQYNAALSLYKEKRKKFIENLEKEKAENLKKKEDLLESLRQMINSNENLSKIYNEFKLLQSSWREIGLVPQNQVTTLWDNYNFLVEKFFDKVKINKELMMIGLKKNLVEKIELCEKTEELLLEKSINKSFKLLQEYHTKWKEVGPVPQDKNDEVWERFKSATDKVNQRRHEHYENLHEEQKNNFILKTALCEKIEMIVSQNKENIKDWNGITNDINALFAEWKTLGPAPKKQNDEIWKRFKTSLNEFYNAKKSFFGQIKDEQMNNYQLKLDLATQAESIKESTDWKNTAYELINLQKKWKSIGPVPRKYSDKVWKSFRAACDYFFNAKNEHFKGQETAEKDNKAKKIGLLETIKNQVFGENQEDNLKIIKDLQRQWIEIGRVPIKDKSKLQNDFKKIIDKHLNALKIDIFEFQNSGLKSKIESLEDKGEAKRIILKEIGYIKGKIENLQKDVTLWETNISFFANSKNADLLKASVESKITKAKKDIDVFKAKMRQFDKMKRDL